jgi:putative SOS response-associated peptidase YedK
MRDGWIPQTKPRSNYWSAYPAEEMVACPVSARVNSPKNADPGLIEPLPQKN